MSKVVITGLGTINPVGSSVKSFWEGLKEERSGVVSLDLPKLSEQHSRVGGRVKLPNEIRQFFRNPKILKRIDSFMIYTVIAGKEALHDSGIDVNNNPHRIGVVIGTGEGGLSAHETNQQLLQSGGINAMHPMYVINAIPNSGVALLAQEIGCHGPSFSVNSACASASHAIGLAKLLIENDFADVVFAGGVEASLTVSGIGAFGNVAALSTCNDPSKASRPFDRDRNGFVLSDGCGIVSLESLEHAKKRNAKIYAELCSVAFSSDAYDMVAPHPEGKYIVKTMQNAIDKARLDPSQIQLVNAHGTSTVLGDMIEAKAIQTVFAGNNKNVMVHSTKSMTGHTIGAAGCIEAIAAILALTEGVVHKSVNLDNPDKEMQLNFVRETVNADVKFILSNSFGFGGHNSSMVLGKTV